MSFKLNHKISKELYKNLYDLSKKENDSFENVLSNYFFRKSFEELNESQKNEILLIEA